MEKLIYKLAFVIILFIATIYYAVPWNVYNINMPFSGNNYRLGLDLQGGVELDYKIDLSQVQNEEGYNLQKEKSIIEGLKSIVDKRIESLKINDSVITTASYGNEKHIIVQIPLKGNNKQENEANIKRAKDAIGKVMKIEFKEQRNEVTQKDLEERKILADNFLKEAKTSEYNFGVNSTIFKDNNENINIGTLTGTTNSLKPYFTLDTTNLKTGIYSEVLTGTGLSSIGISNGELTTTQDKGYWIIDVKSNSGGLIDFNYAFVSGQPSEWMPAKDSKGRVLNEKNFISSAVQYNQAFQPMIELTFNDEGAEVFGELTKRLKGSPIAIFVGGDLLTSPTVNDTILTGKAVITGSYTPKEAVKLSQDINTGVVPAPIYLTSERTIDSKLGANSLTQLINAGIWGFIAIIIFLVLIYRVGGLLAGVSLFIYITLMLAIIKLFGIVLTLAGIAGFILSVGMAIDANVLIFERLKEALVEGKKTNDAIKEGFDKSFSAIWDSNITGIIVSIILFIFGINMIKGFGLMVLIGLIVSLFTALFISKLFISIYSRKKDLNLKVFLGIK
ncbi:protein translocase subunit SecD [Candidatus Gracilibacteria bacterium]|nr:protein translocase subunit SecD [Candidatus Gracilibacteria bacterium]